MSDAGQDEKINQFIAVTGVDANRAKFYLQAAGWDLPMAMSTFYEGGNIDDEAEGVSASMASMAEASRPTHSNQDVSMPTDSSRNASSRIGRINLDPDSSDEEGQAFYAGGSDRSGQQVLGPPRKKKDAHKLVESLFQSARDHGAQDKHEDEAQQAGRAKPSRSFVGTGYRLGETSEDTTVVPGRTPAAPPPAQDKKLKLWKNGFSIDDGPLRDYQDPQNKQFLDSVSRGEVPQELVREARGGEVSLDMEDHRTDDYVKPKQALKAFSGAGNMLGSPAPAVAPALPTGPGDAPAIALDPAQPATSLQLRLADGSRMVVKLNNSHTVGDVRRHIINTHPQYAGANFCLMTTFPNKELVEESQSLEAAGLLNAVVVQRMK